VNGWGFMAVNGFAKATPWLHALVAGYANYGIFLFALLLAAGWWQARRAASAPRLAGVVCAAAATLLAVAVNQPIAAAVHEARPYTAHPGILVLAHRSADFSFPSDHAVMAGAVAAGLWLVSRHLGAIAAVAAVVMAFARVYIASHYPQDVVAGLLLGATVAAVVYWAGARMIGRALTALTGHRWGRLLVGSAPAPAERADGSADRRAHRVVS
jgi:membrane-associated phospholipid phosphatase